MADEEVRETAVRDAHGRFTAGHAIGSATRFGPGNTARLIHGGRSRRAAAGDFLSPEQRQALADERAAIIADVGGDANVSMVKARLIDRWVECGVVADSLASYLLDAGPLTPRGKQRAALGAYLHVLDRQVKLAERIGLRREARRVPTLADLAAELSAQNVTAPAVVEPEGGRDA